jgi:histidine triad (HIT) family protein
MTDCPFCAIARAEAQAALVYSDDTTLAFLDIRPRFFGHCLVTPRQHFETMHDLPSDLAGRLFVAAQVVAGAVERAMGADGTLIAVNNRVSQSVPHVHIHVVPRRHGDGLQSLFWPRQHYLDAAEMARIAEIIRSAIPGQAAQT